MFRALSALLTLQDYFGLALSNPDKYVKLKNANINIRLIEIKKNEKGEAVELIAEHCGGTKANVKVHPIHWVPIIVCSHSGKKTNMCRKVRKPSLSRLENTTDCS